MNQPFASLELSLPTMQQLFVTSRGNQHDTSRHFGTIAGTVPIPEFFSPENTQRAMEIAVHA
jgi:hypothetical protein